MGEVLDRYKMSMEEAEHTDIHKLSIGDVRFMINNRLEQFLSAIKAEIQGKLPEEVTIEQVKSKLCPYSEKIKCCTMQDYVRNEVLSQVKKIIGEME